MDTVKILVKVDCYPTGSPTVMRWLENALQGAEIAVVKSRVGKSYGWGMWEARFVIPAHAHTEQHRARVEQELAHLYATNNPQGEVLGQLVIRGIILEWNPEEEEDAD